MQRIEVSSYLEDKEIYILNKRIPKDKNDVENNIFKQIDNIVCLHNRIGPYKENLFPRIAGTIGKDINNYYCQTVLIDKYIKTLKYKKKLNSIDFYFINRGDFLIKYGRDTLNHIYSNNFRNLIERSMKNYEVCLGRVDESNLKIELDGKINIGTIKYLSYNLKEHDIYSYIKKIKKRETNLNIDEILDYYIEIAKLKNDSKEYLSALISYPNEEVRILEKYIQGKLNINEKEIIDELNIARKIDGNGIII